MARKMMLLKLATGFPAPSDPAEQKELAQVEASLDGDYGKGKWCPDGATQREVSGRDRGRKIDGEEPRRSRTETRVDRLARGGRADARAIRAHGAAGRQGREWSLDFADAGAIWRSKYDMPPDEFAKEVDRLWDQLRPLYLSLHAYVRGQLAKKYGAGVVPANGPIPAHLLGNIWAQEWNNVYPLMDSPKPRAELRPDEDFAGSPDRCAGHGAYGEGFFTSLGFAPLPQTFWERSLFTKPADRDVVCHASAWDVDSKDDLRVKMCIQITQEDFVTIHHELGHNFYQRAYNTQPPLFQNSANDGFHEAVGDTIALSVTPEYLKKIGLIETVPPASGDIDYLLQQALSKVAFLPFGLTGRQVAVGSFLRRSKTGPVQQSVVGFAAEVSGHRAAGGAHGSGFRSRREISRAGETCRTCAYFLARILQFQFQRALCRKRVYRAAASLLDLREQGSRATG